ncbi:MAG: hypothetical protein WCF36_07835 [Candidatus Nanopelagicales bacterium]
MSAPLLSPPRENSNPFAHVPPGEGLAVRGLLFGLLLVLPFWVLLGFLAVTL